VSKCENCGVNFAAKWQDQRFCGRLCNYEFKRKAKIERDSVEWVCQSCGSIKIVFRAEDKRRKFCSQDCVNLKWKKKPRVSEEEYGKNKKIKKCPTCEHSFPARKDNIYCSPKCAREKARKRISNKCEECNIEFFTIPSLKRRFCGKECKLKWREREFKEGKLSLPKKEESKNRNITAHQRSREKVKSGINHRRWRKAVLERDKHTCQKCGSNQKLHVHHIREFAFFPESRFDVNNGLTLCKMCHKKLHKDMKRVGILGYGWVGKAVHKLFPGALIYDPKEPTRNTLEQVNTFCDVVFICVATPNLPDGSLDTSMVEECVAMSRCPLIVIRSTLNPGTTDRLIKKHGKRIVIQPEYIGESGHHSLLDPRTRDFLIFGGNHKDVEEVIGVYTSAYNANIRIRTVTPYEAEVIKLTENRAIAFKVAQCQELYDACKAADVNYYTVRDAVYGDDPRFDLWFTFVYPNKRGMKSSCIPKDVYAWNAWAESLGYDAKITQKILDRNIDWLALNVPEEDLEHIPTQGELRESLGVSTELTSALLSYNDKLIKG
jgi:UDPglucose 6-dehydrogenase